MESNKPAVSYVERRAKPLFLLTPEGLPMRGEREMIEPVRAFLVDLDSASTPDRLDAVLDRHGAEAVADRSLAAIRIRPAEFGGMEASGRPVTNIRDSGGTILHWAARSGDRSEWAIPAVLARGADPDLADENGNTPLMEAIRSRSGPAVKALLVAGADPLLCCPVGGSVMHSAAYFGSVECLRELATGLDGRTMDVLLSVIASAL